MYNYDKTTGTMTLPCKVCGEFNTIDTWYNLDSRKYPEQKKLLLKNELFKYECKTCGNIILAGYEMMYHDADNKVIIYLDQMSQYTKQIKKNIRRQKKEFGKDYKFRIVKSVNQLHEKALIFENKFDDKMIELLILDLVITILAENLNLNIDSISLSFRENMVIFNVFVIDSDSNKKVKLPYEMSYETYLLNEKKMKKTLKLKEELFIDSGWALKCREKMIKKTQRSMSR